MSSQPRISKSFRNANGKRCLGNPASQQLLSDKRAGNNTGQAEEGSGDPERDIRVVEYDQDSSDPSPRQVSSHRRSRTCNFLDEESDDEPLRPYSKKNLVIYDKLDENKGGKRPGTERHRGSSSGFSQQRSEAYKGSVYYGEAKSHQGKSDSDKCRLHSKNLTAFCFTESTFLCVECLLTKMHDRHRVVEISVALEARVVEIERQLETLRGVAPTKAAIIDLEKTLDESFQAAINRNKQLFAEIRAVVDEQEKLFNVRTR
jgi:hypothetical protein